MTEVNTTNTVGESLRDVAGEQRLAHIWQQIETRRTTKHPFMSHLRLGIALAVILACVGIGITVYLNSSLTSLPEPLFIELSQSSNLISVPAGTLETKLIPLSDGSSITIAPGASLEVKDNIPGRFGTSLHFGWARYNVVPNQPRTWEIDTGLCRIIVLGTKFTVNRNPHSVYVAVHRGTVAIYSPTGKKLLTTLSAGQSHKLWVPNHHPKKDLEQTPLIAPNTLESSSENNISNVNRISPLRSSNTLVDDNTNDPSEANLNDLLNQADEARKRNQHQKAAILLKSIVRKFPNHPAVGMAALTLGKIRLDNLHQPKSAVHAFKRALASNSLPPSLQEQALARCVEALYRSGDIKSTQAMSNMYHRRFPNGAWSSWVENWSVSK